MSRSVPIARALSRRMLALSALGFVIGLASTIATRRYLERDATRADADALRNRPAEIARCTARPREFVGRTLSGSWLFAYDSAGRASHPDALALDLHLDARAPVGAHVVQRSGALFSISQVAFRVAADGPCAWLVAHRRTPRFERESLFGGASLALLAMFATLVAVSVGVIRPLLRRIDEVQRFATTVGSDHPRPPPERSATDELDAIVRALHDAHVALRSERSALARSKGALEALLTTTAHDLRTPIASLQLAIERASVATADDTAREALRGAMLDAYYVGALIENLHLSTRMREMDDAPPLSVDLREIVAVVDARMSVVAKHTGVALECAICETPARIQGDPLAIERALSNLVDNAIAHANAHVALVLEHDAAGIELVVADDGPGFDDAAIAHARSLGIAVHVHEAPRSESARSARRSGSHRPRSRVGLSVTAAVARAIGAALVLETSANGSTVRCTPQRQPPDRARPA